MIDKVSLKELVPNLNGCEQLTTLVKLPKCLYNEAYLHKFQCLAVLQLFMIVSRYGGFPIPFVHR